MSWLISFRRMVLRCSAVVEIDIVMEYGLTQQAIIRGARIIDLSSIPALEFTQKNYARCA